MEEVESLKLEIQRLSNELDQTSSEKAQAAQYGLGLLAEKSELNERVDQLEALYETTRHELHITQEALAKFQTSHRVVTESGLETEESLLSESARMESSLVGQISELEIENKALRSELERVTSERQRFATEAQELSKERDSHEGSRRSLRQELKEAKARETQSLKEFTDLEEENVSLQKMISSLESSQVEFESAKHEIRTLREDVEILQGQVEDNSRLKDIAERQLEEALQSLTLEREAKYALRKELDQRCSADTLYNLSSNLAAISSKLTASSDLDQSCDEEAEGGELRRLESEVLVGGGSDLFSEIHLDQIKKYEKKLEESEQEKSGVAVTLKEAQADLERLRSDNSAVQAYQTRLLGHLKALHTLHTHVSPCPQGEESLERFAAEQKARYEAAARELEAAGLRAALQAAEQANVDTAHDLQTLARMVNTREASLTASGGALAALSDEVAGLYHHVCAALGVTPHRVMLQHSGAGQANNATAATQEPMEQQQQQDASPAPPPSTAPSTPAALELLRAALRTDVELCAEATSVCDVRGCVDTVLDQTRHLATVVQTMLDAKAHTPLPNTGDNSGDYSPTSEGELLELQEQVTKLKALLSTKREQIATLRTVLKANKHTAEVALSNLKCKYDTEKTIVSETMMKLRNELRLLKEDAATFSSLRALFGARCEEYVTQLDESSRQLCAAEEEKKTLNSLLRMVIQQKLSLTQRLEDLECDRERFNMRKHAPTGRGGGRGGPGGGGPRYAPPHHHNFPPPRGGY